MEKILYKIYHTIKISYKMCCIEYVIENMSCKIYRTKSILYHVYCRTHEYASFLDF